MVKSTYSGVEDSLRKTCSFKNVESSIFTHPIFIKSFSNSAGPNNVMRYNSTDSNPSKRHADADDLT